MQGLEDTTILINFTKQGKKLFKYTLQRKQLLFTC